MSIKFNKKTIKKLRKLAQTENDGMGMIKFDDYMDNSSFFKDLKYSSLLYEFIAICKALEKYVEE